MYRERHIITCEYPPQIGGVADYTRIFAAELARRGESVHVWTPGLSHDLSQNESDSAFAVHRECGAFRADDLRRLDVLLDKFVAPRKLFVQWVPHGYGRRSLNYNFCRWLKARRERYGDEIDLLVHEPFLPFRATRVAQNFAALAHRVMTVTLLKAACRVWVSIPRWADKLAPFAVHKPFAPQWLPVVSNIGVETITEAERREIKQALNLDGQTVIGHFGTFGATATPILEAVLTRLMHLDENFRVLALGRGGSHWHADLCRRNQTLAANICATDFLTAEALSRHLSVCDIMLQPYIDGVSTRRGSVMAALAHGLPIVTTTGELTEDFWAGSSAVRLCSATDADEMARQTRQLALDQIARAEFGSRARALYAENFTIEKCADKFLSIQSDAKVILAG